MALITFHCPRCHATLKTANADGRMLRCPKCAERFAMPGEQERSALTARLSPVPPPKPELLPGTDGVVEAGTPPEPRKRRAVLAAFAFAALAALLGLGGATYFAWDHLTGSTRNPGGGEEDPLALLPSDSTLVMRINASALTASDPSLSGAMDQHVRTLGASRLFYDPRGAVGLDAADLFHQLTYGIHLPRKDRGPVETYYTLVIRSRVPFSQARVARCFRATPQQMFDKTYFHIDGEVFDKLYMPSDRTIVLTRVPPRHLAALLQTEGTQSALPADVEPLIRRCDGGQVWGAVIFNSMVTDELEGRFDLVPWAPQTWTALRKEMPKARGAGVWMRVADGKLVLRAGVLCGDAEGAIKVADAGDSFLLGGRLSGASTQELFENQFLAPLRPCVRMFIRDGKCVAQQNLATISARGEVADLYPVLREVPEHLMRMRGYPMMPGHMPPMHMPPPSPTDPDVR